MIGVREVKSQVRNYAKSEYSGTKKFHRVEIEGEYAFVGVFIKTGLIRFRPFVVALHHPSQTVVAEEDLSKWGFKDDRELMNDKIDEWLHMSEQELRSGSL